MPRPTLSCLLSLTACAVILAAVCVHPLPVQAQSTTCGGNCPNGCPACPCGIENNIVSIDHYCKFFTGWSQECCQCVGGEFSGGESNAAQYNSNDDSYDVGLYQINDINWGACSEGQPPCDPKTNMECAKKVWNWGGGTWRLWGSCASCGCCDSP